VRRTLVLSLAGAAIVAAVLIPLVAQSTKPAGGRAAAAAQVGPALYEKGLCNVCHGDDRKGNENAPPLVNLKENWDEDSLTAYLKDPARVRAANPRMAKLAETYDTLEMPPWEAPEPERRALAAWLLQQE
jgi:cytochrome c553